MSSRPSLATLGMIAAILTLPAPAVAAAVDWLTRSADNARSGWNAQETQLTQASVTAKGLVRATIIPVEGDARGMERSR